MALTASASRLLKVLSRVLGGAALACWFTFVVFGLQYDKTRPIVALPSEGKVYPFPNHDHAVYLTLGEKAGLDL